MHMTVPCTRFVLSQKVEDPRPSPKPEHSSCGQHSYDSLYSYLCRTCRSLHSRRTSGSLRSPRCQISQVQDAENFPATIPGTGLWDKHCFINYRSYWVRNKENRLILINGNKVIVVIYGFMKLSAEEKRGTRFRSSTDEIF